MINQPAKELLDRYRKGQCSDKERRQVEAWYVQVVDAMDNTHLPEPDYAAVEGKLKSRLPELERKKILNLKTLLPYAAAILIAGLTVSFFWIFQKDKSTHLMEAITQLEEDVAPGTNRAKLTLADGRSIDLSESHKGIVIADQITYMDGSAVLDQTANIEMLTLSTPKGGTYQVTLPDGSKVWLNAETTLKYPSRFDTEERVVELTGEAYFDVVGLKRQDANQSIQQSGRTPFRVITKGQIVEVLGTQFNIAAYPTEPQIKTTLVKGKVRLSSQTKQLILQPGEQGISNQNDLVKNKVDTELFTAWKDGYFYFDRASTKAAVEELARWYDLDVQYKGKLSNINIYAYIERNKPLSAVLNALEKSGLHFELNQINGRKQLIVSE